MLSGTKLESANYKVIVADVEYTVKIRKDKEDRSNYSLVVNVFKGKSLQGGWRANENSTFEAIKAEVMGWIKDIPAMNEELDTLFNITLK